MDKVCGTTHNLYYLIGENEMNIKGNHTLLKKQVHNEAITGVLLMF